MIIGLESELALCPGGLCTQALKKNLKTDIVRAVREVVSAVPNLETGVTPLGFMTANGSRIYLDVDCIEIATPEVKTPTEVITYQRACELILLLALKRTATIHYSMTNAKLIKACTDYNGHFRGLHLNFSAKNWTADALVEHLSPFLATRFFSCAGGFGPSGFVMSQRHSAVKTIASTDVRKKRGIVNLKNEPLGASQYKRIHITHGDQCMSELSMFLSVGATALVVRMLDDGVCVGPAYKLLDPVEALQKLDLDFHWTMPLPLASGLSASALEIQEHYLKASEIYARKHDELWMDKVVQRWRQTVDTLKAKGPDGLSRLIDPYIKIELYSRYIKKAGMTLKEFSCWCAPIALAKSYLNGEFKRDIRGWLYEQMPYVNFNFLEEHMERNRLDWSNLPKAFALYNKMLALDVMFHDISECGMYSRLCNAGIVDSRALLVNRLEANRAINQPPQGTRAQARGNAIREASAEKDTVANWTEVRNANRKVTLTDPLVAEYSWQQLRKTGVKR